MMNNLQKNHRAKLDWIDSETGKMPSSFKTPEKVNFQSSIQFLAACSSIDMEEVVRLLNEGVDINVGNVDGLTALHQACIDSNLPLVEFLIEHGANMDIPDREGWTPLHAAVSCGFIEIVKFLVDNGAHLDALSFDNELPIDVVNVEDKKMREYVQSAMQERGIDADSARDVERRIMLKDAEVWLATETYVPEIDRITLATPLHIAASKNYVDVMDVLLCIPHVDVNALDSDGWTPLHSAAHWGQREACERLVKHPAIDMEIMTYTNQSIMDLADKELRAFLYDARRRFHETKQAFLAEANETSNYDKRKKLSLPRLSTTQKHLIGDKVSAEENSHLKECGILSSDSIDLPPTEDNSEHSTDNVLTVTIETDISAVETPTSQISESVEAEITISDVVTGPENTAVSDSTHTTQLSEEPEVVIIATDDVKHASTEEEPQPDNQTRNKLSAVLSPEKSEKEAQRTTRARQVRASRRSTQGVTLEDIQAAKDFGHSPAPQDKKTSETSSVSTISAPALTITPSSPSREAPPSTGTLPPKIAGVGEDTNNLLEDRKAVRIAASSTLEDDTAASSLLPSRQTRRSKAKLATTNDAVDSLTDTTSKSTADSAAPSRTSTNGSETRAHATSLRGETIEAAGYTTSPLVSTQSRHVTWLNNSTSNPSTTPVQKETTPLSGCTDTKLDYEQLYHLEIQIKEQLMLKLKELQHEKEASENDLARLRKSAHMGILNKTGASMKDAQVTTQKLAEYDDRMKEIERLKQENTKMKEDNIALVGVIRRLSRSRIG